MENSGGAVEGFSLTGEEVANLKDKHFVIIAVPVYQEMQSLDNPDKTKRKLMIPVRLANGTECEWIANKTSQKVIMAKKGRNLIEWVGFEGEFETKNQVVGREEKKVIYLK